MRIVRCRLPGTLLWHPNLNAYSRYVAPTQPMALGTRTPYAQMMHGIYAGLPRNLNSRLAANTLARLKAVFCLPATTQTAPKHQTKKHRSKAFND